MRKKIMAVTLLLALLLLMVAGCGREKKEGEYFVYYLNADVTKLVPEKVELTQKEEKSRIEELLEALQTQPEDASLRRTIPSNVKGLGFSVMSYQITVDFSR